MRLHIPGILGWGGGFPSFHALIYWYFQQSLLIPSVSEQLYRPRSVWITQKKENSFRVTFSNRQRQHCFTERATQTFFVLGKNSHWIPAIHCTLESIQIAISDENVHDYIKCNAMHRPENHYITHYTSYNSTKNVLVSINFSHKK